MNSRNSFELNSAIPRCFLKSRFILFVRRLRKRIDPVLSVRKIAFCIRHTDILGRARSPYRAAAAYGEAALP
jgi:hypothetical protein